MKYKGLFITGTSTGVGKTFIGSNLVSALYDKGVNLLPLKPIESGCKKKNGILFAKDGNKYYLANKGLTPEQIIAPFKFKQVCSTALASKLSKKNLTLKSIIQHINQNINDKVFTIIEGAGGIYSPLTIDALNIHLIKKMSFPVLLVAENSLGCINSILLSLNALEENNLICLGVVLNQPSKINLFDTDNLSELKQYTKLPIISNSFQSKQATAEVINLL